MADSEVLPSNPRVIDAAVAAALVALVIVGTSQIEPETAERTVDWLAFACGIVGASSLVLWRRFPIVVAGVVSIAISVYFARQYPAGPTLLPVPLAMAALGYRASRRVAWLGVAAMLATLAIGETIADEVMLIHLLIVLGWSVAGALAGQALASRGERIIAERERVAHAHEQALANERLRVAQDVHDSVAHAMATINVQSGVAAHLAEHKPEQVGVALEAIRTASRDALEELGTILGVLRDADSAAPRSPLGGLDQISELVERARDDGLRVTLDQTGDATSVSSAVGIAAFRSVQEALTNTRRHAGPMAEVGVTVVVGDRGSLCVTIVDDGGTGGSGQFADATAHDGGVSSGGFGLIGMRERVEASDGTLTFGPRDPAGFRVEARWRERGDQ